jgi:hypothetical protein
VNESRKSGVKLVTRLNSNFVVSRFGDRFKKDKILSLVSPIERTIDGTQYEIHQFNRCIWQKTAGNLFLVRGDGYDNFILIFTTALNSKPETVIRKYLERYSIEQTNKELKSYLSIEGSYFTKKESNYGHIFLTSIAYNFIQFLSLHLDGMSFKDVLEVSSAYLLWKNPPACVFEVDGVLDRAFGNSGCKGLDKINSLFNGRMVGLDGTMA